MTEWIVPKYNVCDKVRLVGSDGVTGKITGSCSNYADGTTKYLVKWYGGKKGRGHVWEQEESIELEPVVQVRARRLTGKYLEAALSRMPKERR